MPSVIFTSVEVLILDKPSEVLRRAKERTIGKDWLPFEAIDIEAGTTLADERYFLKRAINEHGEGWTGRTLAMLFDRAITLAETEESKNG